jgi:hypothetical protein
VEEIDDAVLRVVTDTLENLAFMEAFPVQEDISPGQPEMTAALLFHEPHQGEIRITCPRSLLVSITETLCGLPEEGVSNGLLKDVLAEILNTIAGRFLEELLPDDQTFRIGLPELDPPANLDSSSLRKWCFCAGDDHFTVTITDDFTCHSFARPACQP